MTLERCRRVRTALLPFALLGGGNAAVADLPSVSVDGASVVEGNRGTASLVFPVRLSAPAETTVTLTYSTRDGTAVAGADYVAASGTLAFPAGAALREISVAVRGDLLDEPDETFFLDLSRPVKAVSATPTAEGRIVDDDDPPSLSVDDASVYEGKSGSVPMVIAVRLSAPSGRTVTVDYEVRGETAAPGADFEPAAGRLTFPPGSTQQRVNVVVRGDPVAEPDETLTVELKNPSGAFLADPTGKGTIHNGEPPEAAPAQAYYGDPEEFERPGEVEAARVFGEIPEWQEIQKKNLNPDQAEYWILLEKANQKFYRGINRVAQKLHLDLLGEVNTLPRTRGEVPNVTDATLRCLEP